MAGTPFAVTEPSRLHRLRGPLLTGGVAAGLVLALHFRDPHSSGAGPAPLAGATGYPCPGCGSLWAVNDLTNGDLVGAVSSNLLFVVMLPLLAFWWVRCDPAGMVGRVTTGPLGWAPRVADRPRDRGDVRVRRAAQPAGRQPAGP